MKQTIIVSKIKDTKNPLIKQLELRTEILKPASSNPVAFFLKGVPNVAPGKETRVFYQSVSTDFIKEKQIIVGCVFNEKVGFPAARLVINETLKQHTWTNGDGSEGYQNPKINPSTGVVLTQAGQPIYRNVTLDLTGTAEDVYLGHDVTASTPQSAAQSLSSLANKLEVEEPALPNA